MEYTPKMAALVPAHNDEYTLRFCLESCVDVADEVVVYDDASTDRTEELLGMISERHPNLTWYHNRGEPAGWVDSRNHLLEFTDARWVLFIDADDVLADDAADKLELARQARAPVVRIGLYELWGDFDHGTQRELHHDRCHVLVDRHRFRDLTWRGVRQAKLKVPAALADWGSSLVAFHVKGVKPDSRLVERQMIRDWLANRAGAPPAERVRQLSADRIHQRAIGMLLHSKQDHLTRKWPGSPITRPASIRHEVESGQRFEIIYEDDQPVDREDHRCDTT